MSDSKHKGPKRGRKTWEEFECPLCTAHNPWDDGYSVGDELFCAWCGAVIQVKKVGDDPERCRLVVD